MRPETVQGHKHMDGKRRLGSVKANLKKESK